MITCDPYVVPIYLKLQVLFFLKNKASKPVNNHEFTFAIWALAYWAAMQTQEIKLQFGSLEQASTI